MSLFSSHTLSWGSWKDADQNAPVREDDTASTNCQYNFDFPPRETSDDSGSKPNETLSAKVKQTAIKKSPSQHLATKLEFERPMLAGDLAMEYKQQDAKLLNVISRILRKNHEIPCQRTSSKLHQLEESSSVLQPLDDTTLNTTGAVSQRILPRMKL